jgi:hypothetical protein
MQIKAAGGDRLDVLGYLNVIFPMAEKTNYTPNQVYYLDYSFVFAWMYRNAINADIERQINESDK